MNWTLLALGVVAAFLVGGLLGLVIEWIESVAQRVEGRARRAPMNGHMPSRAHRKRAA